ncbi:MAG: CDP-glycerol glycerophosphotransferase family protein [Syntrophaceae bacterium]|nr:CDP-glycerol glycerophosphotransferase family protein [Syntrophaceae bacterium]
MDENTWKAREMARIVTRVIHFTLVIIRFIIITLLNVIGLLSVTTGKREGGKKKIAFQTYSIHLAQHFQPVITQLMKENVELSFIILPNSQFPLKSARALRAYARDVLLIPNKNIKYYWETIWGKYDLIIYNEVYAKFPIRKTTNWLMSHGTGVTLRTIKRSIFHKTLFDFDLSLMAGSYDVNVVKKFCEKEGLSAELVPIGVPFLDRFADPGISRERYLMNLSLDTNKKTILFAPHWGLTRTSSQILNRYFDQCIAILKELDYNILLKLHACSLNISQAKGVNWKKRVQKLSSIAVDHNFDDIPALAFSDVLITDISSRAFNFMMLNKPVILIFQVPFSQLIEVDKARLMQRGSLVADRLDNLKQLIERAMENPDLLSMDRQKVASECFVNFGRSAEAVVALIKNRIKLEQD